MDTPENRDNPYAHLSRARVLEQQGDLRAAESAIWSAISAADNLPLVQYKLDYETELSKYNSVPNYESLPGVGVEEVDQTYHELLSLPFCIRVQLAGFYARNGALPEASEACDEAFAVGFDPIIADAPKMLYMLKRARELKDTVTDVLGPETLVKATDEYFKIVDRDGDGFLHETELREAMFDLQIDSEGQKMLRHLLYHYFEIEAASNDELGVDINGISRRDVKKFQQKKNSTWRRLKPKPHEEKDGVT